VKERGSGEEEEEENRKEEGKKEEIGEERRWVANGGENTKEPTCKPHNYRSSPDDERAQDRSPRCAR